MKATTNRKLRLPVHLVYLFLSATIIFGLMGCEQDTKNTFSGKWKSQSFRAGDNIHLDITDKNDLFEVHKYSVDKNGNILTGKTTPNKTYLVPVKDGIMKISPMDDILYSKDDDKLYWRDWVFERID